MLPTRHIVRDCFFLGALVMFAAWIYLPHLGFYSDDWAFLGIFTNSPQQSLGALFRACDIAAVKSRPMQLVYMVLLFKAFGLGPFGYHVVNAAVLVSVCIFLYLVLRSLGQQRAIALSSSAIFAMLPHYSSTRFWFAAFQVNLSLALYLISLFADLRILQTSGARMWIWKAIGLGALICSALAYELAMPLFLLNALIVLYLGQRIRGDSLTDQDSSVRCCSILGSRQLVLLLSSNVLVLLLIAAFKVSTSDRLREHYSLFGHLRFYEQIVRHAAVVSFGTYGFEIPRVMWKVWYRYPNRGAAVGGVIVGTALLLYQLQITRRSTHEPMARSHAAKSNLRLCLWGVIVFALGYAIFLSNQAILVSATGIANRVNNVAAIGVAFLFAGGIGAISDRMPAGWNRIFFCSAVAALCACNVAINATIATFWVSAYQKEQAVERMIYQDLPYLPPGSTLLLDGVCPYDGPAIIFESNWDLWGALIIHYRDPTLSADVVSPRSRIDNDKFSTSIYGETRSYKYGKDIFVYNIGRRRIYPLTNVALARQYFGNSVPGAGSGCPKGEPGYGVPIF